MNRYKETFETWNKVASQYQDKFELVELYDSSYAVICNSIKTEEAKILEIGCGPGNITKYLLSKRPDFRIYGIDIAPNMIALAKENNPSAVFDVMDSREIDRIQEKFDGVVCGFCMPYMSPADCEKLFEDAYDLLAENGLLYLSFVEGNPQNSGFQSSNGDRVYFYYHSLVEIRNMLIEHQYKEMETFKFQYTKHESEKESHVVLIARKKTVS